MATRPATTWAPLNDGATPVPYSISRPYFAATTESAKPYAMFSCGQTTMSPNGKWLIINYEKFLGDSGSLISTARYDLQTDEVEFFSPNDDDERFAEVGAEVYGFGVADDGRYIAGFAYISPEDQDEDEYYLSWVLDTQDPDAAGSATAVAPIVVKDKDKVAKIKALYSLDGARRNTLSKGINILRMSDGKSLKKLVK
ncbi:MAG: hypothetical protein UDK33_03905 [Prevotella sp.]|nr:hypothetical protein [Prevotella sp.]